MFEAFSRQVSSETSMASSVPSSPVSYCTSGTDSNAKSLHDSRYWERRRCLSKSEKYRNKANFKSFSGNTFKIHAVDSRDLAKTPKKLKNRFCKAMMPKKSDHELGTGTPVDGKIWVPRISSPTLLSKECSYRLQNWESNDLAQTGNSSITPNTQIMTRSQLKMLKSSGRKSSFSSPAKKSSSARTSKVSLVKTPKSSKFFGKSNSKLFLDGVINKVMKKSPVGDLFGRPLEEVCGPSDLPPKVIMDLLFELMSTGPNTDGIFRKCGSARLVKEWRELIDNGTQAINFDELNIFAVTALLKEYFRSLPVCLLGSSFYDDWLKLPKISDEREKLTYTKNLLSRLKKPDFNLIKLLMAVLKLIGDSSDLNKMTYSNLSVCIGPSILWPLKSKNLEYHEDVTTAVQYLIENCHEIFGKESLDLLINSRNNDDSRANPPTKHSNLLTIQTPTPIKDSSHSNLPRKAFKELKYHFNRNLAATKRSISAEYHVQVSSSSSSTFSIQSRDSGLSMEYAIDSPALQDMEFHFTDYNTENKENSQLSLNRKTKPFNYSKNNYHLRYRISPSPFRRDEWMRRRSLFRKIPKKKSLFRAASEESILLKLANEETKMDFLDRQLLTEEEESNLTYKKMYSTTNASKDSGFTIEDASIEVLEEDELEILHLNDALKRLDCQQPLEVQQANVEDTHPLNSEDKRTTLENDPSITGIRPLGNRDSMKKIETFDAVDGKNLIFNNEVIFTDEPLCPFSSDDESSLNRSVKSGSKLTSNQSFKRNSWMRKRSKTKMKYTKSTS